MEILQLIFDWLQPVVGWTVWIGGIILFVFVFTTVGTLLSYGIQQVVEAFLPFLYLKKEEEWENRTNIISWLCALAFWLYFMFAMLRIAWFGIVSA